jgi:hypothetical protein
MYYIYHIKGIKWGCTNNLERRLKDQNYTINNLDRLITVGNIDKATELEKDLNLEYGYGGNQLKSYKQTYQHNLANSMKGATASGKKNRETGHIQSLNYLPHHVNKQIITCPHCNKSGKYPAMKQWHFDRCRFIK